MLEGRKTAWWHLAGGLFWLLIAARNIWAPGFLAINRHHEGYPMLEAAVAGLYLTGACRQFMRMRTAATR